MIKIPENLRKSEISAVIFEGLTAKTSDGRPARLAIIDADGNIIEAGADVAAAAWNVAIDCYRNFLIGKGHLKIFAGPAAGGGKVAA